MKVSIRPAAAADQAGILRLNESALPHVNSISSDELSGLADMAFCFNVALWGSSLAGFMLALAQGCPYGSENYRWFSRRYTRFVYVDRVVVATGFSRMGVGRRLYEELMHASKTVVPHLTCEVNLQPPNPGSLAFHHQLGFEEVGRQQTEGGSKRVSLMCKALSS